MRQGMPIIASQEDRRMASVTMEAAKETGSMKMVGLSSRVIGVLMPHFIM